MAWTSVEFTKAQSDRILAAIRKRGALPTNCPLCRYNKWTLANGLISLKLVEPVPPPPAWLGTTTTDPFGTTNRVEFADEAMLAYGLVCTNCGHILFLSAAALGNPHFDTSLIPPPPSANR